MSPPDSNARVIDIRLPKRRFIWQSDVVVIQFLAAVPCAVIAINLVDLRYSSTTPTILTTILCFGAVFVATWRRYRRLKRQVLRELARALRSEDPSSAVGVLFHRLRPGLHELDRIRTMLFHHLARRGYRGCAIRLLPPGADFDVTPIGAAIEARVVRDSDVSFNELRAALDTPRAKWTLSHWSRRHAKPWMAAILSNVPLLGLWLPLRREQAVIIGLTVAIGVFVFFWTARQLHMARRSPQRPAGQIRFVTSKAPDDATWLLVNGGILLRWPDGETWLGRLLPRDEHILFMYPLNKASTHWKVLVFISPQEQYSRELSSSECEVMLRAWRSPHPPPTGKVFGAV